MILGPLTIILAINVSHDAIHGVAHSNKFWNNFFKYQMDLIGANSYLWKQRHKNGHHNFPNTVDKDPDIKQSDLVKILPKSRTLYFHKYQHIYVPFLYSLYTINWIYIRDFKDVIQKNNFIENIPKKELLKFIFFKILYFSIFVLFPVFFSSLSVTEVFIANLLLHVFASYFLTIALLPSHVSEHSTFIYPNKKGVMPYSWAYHQVITTSDFATNHFPTTWLLGGFNHHISHHLFPNISHIHYPQITLIVKEKIKKYGLEYKYENSILKAYLSHYNLLKKNGKSEIITF
jgi:linoleoyl-CoA desaturase